MKQIGLWLGLVSFLIFFVSVDSTPGEQGAATLNSKERLGRLIFFDNSLSEPPGQSCADCHSPEVGWTGPDQAANRAAGVYQGAVKGRFGNRRAPASAYAGNSPILHIDEEGNFLGGMFWDGRATGETLGDPLAEQAMGPPLNPLEQNMPNKAAIVARVKAGSYANLFEQVWGAGSLGVKDPDKIYEKMARSIAAFERSSEVNPFRSKFDDFWRKAKASGRDPVAISLNTIGSYTGMGLSPQELRGMALFATKGRCANCHSLASLDGNPPVFTDFGYDNVGVPRNPSNPFYKMPAKFNPAGTAWVDRGLGEMLSKSRTYSNRAVVNMGKHKTPTLRNVDKRPRPDFVKAYMHNGAFKSLDEIVRFYNTRTAPGSKWAAPEVPENVNATDLGNLGLAPRDEADIVLFLKTLTDR